MNILGINWGEHDSAASLLQDGRLVAAAEEERFNRIKHAPFAFPIKAARYCLEAAGITRDDVDIVAFSFRASIALGRGIWHAIRHFPKANLIAVAELVRRAWYVGGPAYARYSLKLPSRTKYITVPHHLAHAASSFFLSPFSEAAVLVVDGIAEWAATSLYRGVGNHLQPLKRTDFPHSLGLYYSAFTEYLGFKPFNSEYKVMGMAPYGEPRFYDRLREIVHLKKDAGYQLDLRYFNFHRDYGRTTWYGPRMVEEFGPVSTSTSAPAQIYFDIAASVQKRLEDALFHQIEHLHERTGLANLCMAGGVALNSVANGKIARRGPFERVFVQPASNDAGCALGAALYVHHNQLQMERREPLRHVYLGPEYDARGIEKLLRVSQVDYEAIENPPAVAAGLLAEGKIVGWFQGRMEFGPRALGNRSILADPRRADMKDRINAAVKFREPFRPFAPSVLEDQSHIYFENGSDLPYMLQVVKVRPGMAERIPAVTHVDGTARPQTVNRETNPSYCDLLEHFGEETGVPVLLNTSFNVKGEPIVCTPREALACFFNTGMDALVLGRFLLRKRRS